MGQSNIKEKNDISEDYEDYFEMISQRQMVNYQNKANQQSINGGFCNFDKCASLIKNEVRYKLIMFGIFKKNKLRRIIG